MRGPGSTRNARQNRRRGRGNTCNAQHNRRKGLGSTCRILYVRGVYRAEEKAQGGQVAVYRSNGFDKEAHRGRGVGVGCGSAGG